LFFVRPLTTSSLACDQGFSASDLTPCERVLATKFTLLAPDR
jgi:hypothetical protein